VVGATGTLYIGNSVPLTGGFRNPGSGAIDEFAIWHDELSPAEILAQFNAIIPSSPAPVLNIVQSGANALLSWPTNGSDGFHLENTDSLAPSAWVTNASPVTVIGTNNVVTNTINSVSRYFRLKKP